MEMREGGRVMTAPVIQLPYPDAPAPKSWVGRLHDRTISDDEFKPLFDADTRTLEELKVDVARSKLRLRGISEDDIEWWVREAKVRYCDSRELNRRFGIRRDKHGDLVDGLLIPFFDADGNPVMDCGRPFERVRLNRWEGQGKYRNEAGTAVHAYLPPLLFNKSWRDVFRSAEDFVVITEGEFKAGAAVRHGLPPTIGLTGVDCLTTKKAGLVPELAGLKLTNRLVYVAFDAPTHPDLEASITRAANYLMIRGARVKIVRIEKTAAYESKFPDAKGKMGLDDFLFAGGTWRELMDTSVEIEDDLCQNQLFSQIAILLGPAQPSYVHVADGPSGSIGTVRTKAAMVESFSDQWVEKENDDGETKFVNAFKDWTANPRRTKLKDVVVRPDLPPLSITPDQNWNSWPGIVTLPKQNRRHARFFYRFLVKFFSHSVEERATVRLHRKRFLQWMAHIFQHPETRQFTSWTFLSKHEGIGKSALLEMVAHIIGAGDGGGAYIATADDLESPWTDYLQGKAYIVYNEPSNNNAKLRQKTKNLRTDTHLNCNTKYGAKFRIPNIVTFGFTTNEDYPFGISETARRDWVWEPKWEQTDRAWMAEAAKFGELACGQGAASDEFRAAVLYELLHSVDLRGYDPKAPAGASKAKIRAAKASTSLTGLRKEDILNRVLAELDNRTAVAWRTEKWAAWVGEGYSPTNALADKIWLKGELEKRGYHAGSVQVKADGGKPTLWFASRRLWSDLSTEEKTRARLFGEGLDEDEIATGEGEFKSHQPVTPGPVL